MSRPLHIAYVLLHFPYLTETFVAEEMRALMESGMDLSIISLLDRGQGPVHPVSQRLLERTRYAPGLLSIRLWIAQVQVLLQSPRRYFQLLWRILSCPTSNNFFYSLGKRIVIFLKGVAVSQSIQADDIDMIHAHFAWYSGVGAWICSQILGIPFTLTVHAFDLFLSTDFLQLLSAEASHLVAISDHNQQVIADMNIRPGESTSVIHCGVDMSKFPFSAGKHREDPIDSRVRILSVGSLTRKKGHHTLIEACKLLHEEGLPFVCDIIGEGSEREYLQSLIERYDLQDHVRLTGALVQPDVHSQLKEHNLFVLASEVAPSGDRDGIPVVLMEAGAAELAIISTEVSGIPELVRANETGILVPPGDVQALAKSISRLAANSELCFELGRNARKLVEAEFNIDRSVKQLADLFDHVVQEGNAERIGTPVQLSIPVESRYE